MIELPPYGPHPELMMQTSPCLPLVSVTLTYRYLHENIKKNSIDAAHDADLTMFAIGVGNPNVQVLTWKYKKNPLYL